MRDTRRFASQGCAYLVWWTELNELLELVGNALVQISLEDMLH
jgi:hypothetical protein